ncbi:MAG: kelch repeat-containing protein [Myxococcota bacterium]
MKRSIGLFAVLLGMGFSGCSSDADEAGETPRGGGTDGTDAGSNTGSDTGSDTGQDGGTETDPCSEVRCDDGNPCTDDSCGSDGTCQYRALTEIDCDDGDLCTVSDRCIDGSCVGAAISCTFLDRECVAGQCDPQTGSCVSNTAVRDGSPCSDDQNVCTTDVCADGACGVAFNDCGTRECGLSESGCNDCGQCEPVATCEVGTCAPFEWRRLSDNGPKRSRMGMAWDEARGELVLFGGSDADGRTDDTWVWRDGVWTKRTPDTEPPETTFVKLAYDSIRQRVWMFGGNTGFDGFDSLYSWDGETWTLHPSSVAPSPRYEHGFAFDPNSGLLFVFGGESDDDEYLNDLWSYDPATSQWTEHSTAEDRPSPRRVDGFASHPQLGLCFEGGYDDTNLHDTWCWKDGRWSQLNDRRSPGRGVLAYDPNSQTLTAFGGGYTDETRYFDGSGWIEVRTATRPRGRNDHAVVFSKNFGFLMYGGGYFLDDEFTRLGDLWVYAPVRSE